ncbi:hypothetical protein, partial [Burkholderia contaminans]|uniref:hypothetical protein n=1 Tax=Burkholderia contaminans TaxID=488447 RepID=UPI001C8A5B9C
PLPALSLAQAPGIPLTRLSEFARPPLFAVFSAVSTFSCKYPLVPGGRNAYSGTRSLIVSHAPAG